MTRRQLAVRTFGLALLAALVGGSALPARQKDTPKPNKASGILMDKSDNSVKVKVDGEDEPVTYTIDTANKKLATALAMALKGIHTVSRVQVTWKGEDRQLTNIKKIPTAGMGTVKGEVLATHDWWVEVKPKGKVADGYAVKFPFDKNKAMMDKVKSLQKGDIVVIQFSSDFERHRILALKVVKSADK